MPVNKKSYLFLEIQIQNIQQVKKEQGRTLLVYELSQPDYYFKIYIYFDLF